MGNLQEQLSDFKRNRLKSPKIIYVGHFETADCKIGQLFERIGTILWDCLGEMNKFIGCTKILRSLKAVVEVFRSAKVVFMKLSLIRWFCVELGTNFEFLMNSFKPIKTPKNNLSERSCTICDKFVCVFVWIYFLISFNTSYTININKNVSC